MEVVFYPNGYPIGEQSTRKMIGPRLYDDDKICYAPNPKIVGSASHKLYQRYGLAQSVAEAKRLGARPIDFAFDSNWGYLTVSKLSLVPHFPVADAALIRDALPACRKGVSSKVGKGEGKMVKLRVLEMSVGHNGLNVPRQALAKLAACCPALRGVEDEKWAAVDGPFAKVPLDILRVLLEWATVGKLLYQRRRTKAVYNALLKACGNKVVARLVKQLEAKESRKESRAKEQHTQLTTKVRKTLKLKRKR